MSTSPLSAARLGLLILAATTSLLAAPAAAEIRVPPDPSPAGPADPLALKVRRGLADSVYGQVHYLTSRPGADLPKAKWKTPLVLFHQSPLSSREFGPFVAEMGRDRIVIAFDTPGQGLSDGPDRPVPIAHYAQVADKALTSMGYGARKPVDLFGTHTGIWIASELALQNPKLVRKIVLSGIYAVPEEVWRAAIARLHAPKDNGAFFEQVAPRLAQSRTRHMQHGMSDADWGRMMVESLTPLTRREFAHISAFAYAADAPVRLPMITQPVSVLVIDDGIAAQTRASLPLFKTLDKVVERMDWHDGLFYTHTADVGVVIRGLLD